LDASGDTERLRRAHADYYLGVIIAAEPKLRRDPRPVIEQYRADLPNIRATLRWSLEVKEGGRVARMAVAMWPFLWIAGLLSESVEVVQQALDDETALSAAERAHARLGLGMLAGRAITNAPRPHWKPQSSSPPSLGMSAAWRPPWSHSA
jgi:hypothetical protein